VALWLKACFLPLLLLAPLAFFMGAPFSAGDGVNWMQRSLHGAGGSMAALRWLALPWPRYWLSIAALTAVLGNSAGFVCRCTDVVSNGPQQRRCQRGDGGLVIDAQN